jgi:hypothetical protein
MVVEEEIGRNARGKIDAMRGQQPVHEEREGKRNAVAATADDWALETDAEKAEKLRRALTPPLLHWHVIVKILNQYSVQTLTTWAVWPFENSSHECPNKQIY